MNLPLSNIRVKPFNQPKQKGNYFEDNCTDGLYSWAKLSSSGTWTSTRNGFEYVGDAVGVAKIYIPGFNCINGIFESEVLIKDTVGDLHAGIILRNNNIGNGGYLFRLQRISSNYTWGIENQGILGFTTGSFNWNENAWYKLGISVIGTKIKGFINGVKVVTIIDSTVINLNPALYANTFSSSKFRNIKIVRV